MTRKKQAPTFAVENTDAVADQEATALAMAERSVADMRVVLALPEGRRLVARVLAETRLLGRFFDPDPRKDAFNQGAREIGLRLKEWIETADAAALAELLIPRKD